MIKWAVEVLYEVVVERVNTLVLPDGRKKALVRLAPEYSAAEVATKLGVF
jgi:ribosomal protein L23